jgi:hypothetical protein
MPDIFIAPKDKENNPVDDKISIGMKESSNTMEGQKPNNKPEENKKYKFGPKHIEKPHTKNPLAAFAYYPEQVRFETQEDQEEIVFLLRRHVITNLPWIFLSFIFLIAPFFIVGSFKFITPFDIPVQFIIAGSIIWYSLVISFIFMNFINWYFNVYILTNERIVDVDFVNLTYKQVASAPIGNVQDVTFKLGGVIRTIFNFGDVFIQTAGEERNFDFDAVPKPDQVARGILKIVETHHGNNNI